MTDYRLDKRELAELRAAHRQVRDVRAAYRINAVVLLGQGWSTAEVAGALLMDPETVRSYFKRYTCGGVEELLRMSYVGSEARLDPAQMAELDAHLRTHLYLTAEAVARWVEQRWGVRYTPSGMTAVLHCLGYTYKKAKLTPGKPDPERQEAFLETYKKIKENKEESDPIYFMDATHPQHNPVIGCGWIKRGEDYPIKSNTGRQRLNINGAIEYPDLLGRNPLRCHHRCRLDHRLVPADREGKPTGQAHCRDLRQCPLLPFSGGSGVPEDLAHTFGVPAGLFAQSQPHRALLEVLQAPGALQPILRNVREVQGRLSAVLRQARCVCPAAPHAADRKLRNHRQLKCRNLVFVTYKYEYTASLESTGSRGRATVNAARTNWLIGLSQLRNCR